MSFVKKNNAMVFLIFNAVLWGSSYVWSKMLLSFLPRFSILFLCALGGLVTTLVLFFPSIRTLKAKAILPSLAVSAFSVLSNTFFMLALQHTSSSNTAFIVQLSVILTPVMMAVLDWKIPEAKILAGAVTAVVGLFLVTCDFRSFSLNPGDMLALCNALFFSLFLIGQNRICGKVEAVHFSFLHHGFNTVIFLTLAIGFELQSVRVERLTKPLFAILAVVSVFIAVTTVLFQSAAIKYIRPERATLVYTLEPVTALLLAWFFMGERLNGIHAVIGCILILAAVLLTVYKPVAGRRKQVVRPPARQAL